MADLSHILGPGWQAPTQSPEKQLKIAMLNAGIFPPGEIEMDGKIHRFATGDKPTDKSGWYIIFDDGDFCAGRFGDWRLDIDETFHATTIPREDMFDRHFIAASREAREAYREEVQGPAVSSVIEKIWAEAKPADTSHMYLVRKMVSPYGAKQTSDGRLILPMYNSEDTLISLQYIDDRGVKRYHAGTVTQGGFWQLGDVIKGAPVYITEGFASGATVHALTGHATVIAYNASNLIAVGQEIRRRSGASQDIVIVADNDLSGLGEKKAREAAMSCGARVIMPPIHGDINDYCLAGHDCDALFEGVEKPWLIPADEFADRLIAAQWLIRNWLPKRGLSMLHGPSGSGKTFIVLDWCLSIATGRSDWFGHSVTPGAVVYLAGEGYSGLGKRILAWKQHYGVRHINMWLSESGCDLDTKAGFVKVIDAIDSLPESPAMIVVDTLHTFMAGDENKAQDARSMIASCTALEKEFGCCVLLVHHTGVSDDAQHRARGSSAWRAALDTEASAIMDKESSFIHFEQKKSKDADLSEPLCFALQQIDLGALRQIDIKDLENNHEEMISSAVIRRVVPTLEAGEKESAIYRYRKLFENAWWASGCEEALGRPYLSKSAMLEYLVSNQGMTESSAKKAVQPAAHGRIISELLLAEVIAAHDHGWIVDEDMQASTMLLRKRAD